MYTVWQTVCRFSQLVDGHFTLGFSQQLSAAINEVCQFVHPLPSTETNEPEEDVLRLEPSSFSPGMLCALSGHLTFVDEVGQY